MAFDPEFKHNYFGAKIELDSRNRKLLLKRVFLGKSRIFDLNQVHSVRVAPDPGSNTTALHVTVKDLQDPDWAIYFLLSSSANEWMSRLKVACNIP